MRGVVVAGSVLGAALVGWWFGEAGRGVGYLVYALLPIVGFCVAGRSARGSAGSAFAVVCAGALGVLGGIQVERSAFNDCIDNCNEVRVALEEHRSRTGSYPAHLDDLPIKRCERLLRGTLLEYRRSEMGYSLSFSDWLVSHDATAEHGFEPHT